DWLLNLDPASSRTSAPSPQKKKRFGLRVSAALFVIFGLILLPFFLLVRPSLFLNVSWNWNAWLSLSGGILVTVLLLVFYILIFFRSFPNKKLLLKFSLAGTG
ncbi:MAG TPA: hypothetical protein DD671_12890, partial [Balneolaceae bacterium]|nr:hypothetical protein [Balneolaceae bacterium]